jgi:hypothetical protein
MKRILMLLVVLALLAVVAGPLMAQANPFVGTWKLNVAKSKAGSGPALPQSLTRTVAADGAGATYTFTGVSANGKPMSYSFSTNYDGKDGALTGNGAPGGADTISIKRVAPSKSSAVLKKAGTEVGTSVAEVSKDGKVTTITMKGKGADGKEFTGVTVYDKQ